MRYIKDNENKNINCDIKKLSLKNDVVFKELFSKAGNEIFLKDFLSDLLNIDIKEIEVTKDASLKRNIVDDKFGVLDIKATLNDSEIINIEMQVRKDDYIEDRALYYSSKLIFEQLKSGDFYKELKPVIIIGLLDFSFLPFKEYITETMTVTKKHKDYEIMKKQRFIFVELPKFRKLLKNGKISQNTKTNQWLTFIDGESKKGVSDVMVKNKTIKKADEELEYLTGDEEVRRIAELREKYLKDHNSSIACATERGYKKGEKAGIKRGKIEQTNIIARSLLKENLDIKMIMKVTNLSEKEIKKLSNG